MLVDNETMVDQSWPTAAIIGLVCCGGLIRCDVVVARVKAKDKG